MILPDEVWCVHILPYLPLLDLYNFYRASMYCAQLVERSSNWTQRYLKTFPGSYIDTDSSHFINYYTRATARMHCWGEGTQQRCQFDPDLSIKEMKSAFQGSVLTILDTDGKVHGLDIVPVTPIREIWGLTFYVYGTTQENSCQIAAWTSKTGPSLGIIFEQPVMKVSSCGYLCGVLTARREIYWWAHPHCNQEQRIDSSPLQVPYGIKDMIVTRYGFRVVGEDGNLYYLQFLDQYLRQQPVKTTVIEGNFTRIDQTGRNYVVYGEKCFIGDEQTDALEQVHVPHIESIQLVNNIQFILTKSYNLYAAGKAEKLSSFGLSMKEFSSMGGVLVEGQYTATNPVKIPGKYAAIVGTRLDICTLRMM